MSEILIGAGIGLGILFAIAVLASMLGSQISPRDDD